MASSSAKELCGPRLSLRLANVFLARRGGGGGRCSEVWGGALCPSAWLARGPAPVLRSALCPEGAPWDGPDPPGPPMGRPLPVCPFGRAGCAGLARSKRSSSGARSNRRMMEFISSVLGASMNAKPLDSCVSGLRITLIASATRFSAVSHPLISSAVTQVGKLPKKTVKLIRGCLYLRKRGFCFRRSSRKQYHATTLDQAGKWTVRSSNSFHNQRIRHQPLHAAVG